MSAGMTATTWCIRAPMQQSHQPSELDTPANNRCMYARLRQGGLVIVGNGTEHTAGCVQHSVNIPAASIADLASALAELTWTWIGNCFSRSDGEPCSALKYSAYARFMAVSAVSGPGFQAMNP